LSQRVEGIQNVVLKLVQYNGKIQRQEILRRMKDLCGSKGDKLKSQVDQALYCLKNKGLIQNLEKGTWQPIKECERCNLSLVCSALTNKNGRNDYCPVRGVYIGDPKSQCTVLHGFDYETLQKKLYPKRQCYFLSKPSELEIEHMKNFIEERNI